MCNCSINKKVNKIKTLMCHIDVWMKTEKGGQEKMMSNYFKVKDGLASGILNPTVI